jgi:hypothetical protein
MQWMHWMQRVNGIWVVDMSYGALMNYNSSILYKKKMASKVMEDTMSLSMLHSGIHASLKIIISLCIQKNINY